MVNFYLFTSASLRPGGFPLLQRLVDALVSLLGPTLPAAPAHGWLLPAPVRTAPRPPREAKR